MSYTNHKRKADRIIGFFGDKLETLSREVGFVKRRSKLDGRAFVTGTVVGWGGSPQAPLNEIVQCLDELGVSISEAGFQQRIGPAAVELLEAAFRQSIRIFQGEVALSMEILNQFNRVNILDSTIITLPAHMASSLPGNGCAAGAKIQLSFDFLHGHINALEVGPGRQHDAKTDLHLRQAVPNSLTLFDLGYFDQEVFDQLHAQGAYYVSRFQAQTKVCDPQTHEEVDILNWLQAQPNNSGEVSLLMGRKALTPIRLVFQRCSAPVAEERRRKAKQKAKKKGRACSPRHLALQDWQLYITNVPGSRLSYTQVTTLYRLRWQIELLFKLWKSHAALDKVGRCCAERILCQLYARLIALVIFHWLSADLRLDTDYELSLFKSHRIFRRFQHKLLRSLADAYPHKLAQHLAQFENHLRKYARKNHRRTSPSTLDLLAKAA